MTLPTFTQHERRVIHQYQTPVVKKLISIEISTGRPVESAVGIVVEWVRILAYITGTVDQELLLRNEHLAAENRILKAQIKTWLRLTEAERVTLAEIAHRVGRKALEEVANVVKPDTLVGWYRRLVARKFDGSESRHYPGRPIIDSEIEQLTNNEKSPGSAWETVRV